MKDGLRRAGALAGLFVTLVVAALPTQSLAAAGFVSVASPLTASGNGSRAPWWQQGGSSAVAALSAALDITPSATVTAATATPVPSATVPSATVPPLTATATVTPTQVATPTATATPTVVPVTVRVVSVGVYVLVHGHEQRIVRATVGMRVRLKIIASVRNAPAPGAFVTASWQLRAAAGQRYLNYRHGFTLLNGNTGLYEDVVIPTRGLGTGTYLFTGSLTYNGSEAAATTRLQVVGQATTRGHARVHYAHLRLVVPDFWFVLHKDSKGQDVSGKNVLVVFSNTRRAALYVVSTGLNTTPSTADLKGLPPLLLGRIFGSVNHVKPIAFKSQIDGHDVFAVQGEVPIGSQTALAISIVTNKKRQLYSLTVINYRKSALPSEVRAGLAAVFGAKLD